MTEHTEPPGGIVATEPTAADDPYLATVTDPECLAMRSASGSIDDVRPLVTFLYCLGRDHLPLGTVEGLILSGHHSPSRFTNGWLAQWAGYTADRLSVPARVVRPDPDLARRLTEHADYFTEHAEDAFVITDETRMLDDMRAAAAALGGL